MPGRKPRMYFGTPEDEQGKQSSLHAQKPLGKRTPRIYFEQSEPVPAPPEDTLAALPEEDTDTIEPIQASEDELAVLLRQLDTPPAKERQPEEYWQQENHEPDRYQPAQGQSRLGRDIQTGGNVDVTHASRRQGLYIIGLQGYGKSGLMENLVIQDIKQHIGVCVLDPHGELVDHVIGRLPDSEKEKKVILLDLTEEDFFIGLNLFTCSNPNSPKAVQKVVDQVMHIFEKLFNISRTTPQMAYYLRNCTRTIVANPGCTMAEIPLLLTDEGYRSKLTANVTDPQVRLFWQQYERLKPSEKDEKASPILNKLDEFLQPLPRNIIGQSSTTIDLQQIMDEGKILLVKLDRQLEQLTSLIGSILVALILNASAARKTHKLFNLYTDEFQNFATEDFAVLLEQARKKDIGVTMAHQNRGQLELSEKQADANLKKRTLSVDSLVVFRVPTDADELAGQFPQKPEEAREEEIEKESLEVRKPQRHRRVEEQVEEEVEEEIKAIPTNPVDFLVSARGTHGSARVRRATQEILVPLVHAAEGKGDGKKEYHEIIAVCSPYVNRGVVKQSYHGRSAYPPRCGLPSLQEGKNLLNALLVDVMEGRLQLRTRELAGRIEAIVITLAGFIGWYGFPTFGEDRLSLGYEWRLESGLQYESSLFRAASSLIRGYVALGYQPGSSAMKASEQEFHDQLLEMLQKRGYKGNDGEYGSEVRALALKADVSLKAFVQNLHILCKELATEEGKIKVPTGQKRMVKRIRKYPTWLTDESEKITHPRIAITHQRRSEQDMIGEVARMLKKLPLYTARVMITTQTGLEEHTIRTLKPEEGLQGKALQERIARIQTQNRTPSIPDSLPYCRSRQEIEEEIKKRQERYSPIPQIPGKQSSQPLEDEPPISRRQRPHQ